MLVFLSKDPRKLQTSWLSTISKKKYIITGLCALSSIINVLIIKLLTSANANFIL